MNTNMTVARALKEKSRIITKIAEIRGAVSNYNSVDLGTRRPISVKDSIEKVEALEENLMRIKVALHSANVGIARQLAELMLVRGQIAFYERLDTSEFRAVVAHDDGETRETKVPRDVVLGQVEALAKVEALKNKLDSLQDEIDEYNATHKVDVELL